MDSSITQTGSEEYTPHAVLGYDSSLSFTGTLLEDNRGGVTAYDGGIEVDDCEFRGTGPGTSAVLSVWSIAHHAVTIPTLSITGSIFEDNQRPAAVISGDYGDVTEISDNRFLRNVPLSGPGAIRSDGFTLPLNDNIFEGNESTDSGGAIYLGLGGRVESSGDSFIDNVSAVEGGAVHRIQGASLQATGTTFSGNRADSGGAIGLDPNGIGGSVSLTDCELEDDTAAEHGGRCTWVDRPSSAPPGVTSRGTQQSAGSVVTWPASSAKT